MVTFTLDAMESSSEQSSSSTGISEQCASLSLTRTTLQAHLELLRSETGTEESGEVETTPLFTEPVRKYAAGLETGGPQRYFTQYGLLAGDISNSSAADLHATEGNDPRLFYNIAAPSSIFICGSQGSGKSHTLSCLLENCVVPSVANVLPRPLTGVVFHYDTFVSDTGGSPCEAAFLSSERGVKVRVLCPPTNLTQIKRIYGVLPNVEVEELRINESDLNTKRMLELMAVSSTNGAMPLYLHVIVRILRDQRILQQQIGGSFNYAAFKRAINDETLTDAQLAPLQQRLETLESFMVKKQAAGYDLFGKKGGGKGGKMPSAARGNDWTPKAGQITIVDLSCPCVTAEMACSLFNICLSLFLEQKVADVGRVIALDEAHKYMTDSAACQTLTESLLSTIRLQRHLGTRVIISTQEPTISPRLLDLCSVTIVHRFTSPDWLQSLKKHLAGASVLSQASEQDGGRMSLDPMDISLELFSKIVALRTGEALLFAPSAIIGIKKTTLAHSSSESESDAEPDSSVSTHSSDESDAASTSETPMPRKLPTRKPKPQPAPAFKKTLVRLGHGVMKVRIRKRVTRDGGRSIMAS